MSLTSFQSSYWPDKGVVRGDELAGMIPRFSGRALYWNRVYMMNMTRKDKMKKGFVTRIFHIPEDLDEKLRIKAIKNKVRPTLF